MKLRMISGDFPQHTAMQVVFKSVVLAWGFSKDKKLSLNDNVASVEVLDDEKTKSLGKAAAGAVAGAVLLGPLGAVLGGMASGNKRNMVVDCKLKDGKAFIAEVDSEGYKKLLSLL